jgi:pilus assembly protein CpaD
MWWTDAARVRAPAAALLALAASACASPSTPPKPAPLTPTEQYSIKVEQAPDHMALTVHPNGLSPTQRSAIVAMVGRWREAPEAGDFAVQTPTAGADPEAAARTASEVVAALRVLGVPNEQVRTGPYEGAPGGAPVLVSFTRLVASVADCQGEWGNLTSSGSNRSYDSYGCAVTSNMAAQVVNPRDFLSPAPVQAADATRRQNVLDKYRKGEITSTARDDQAAGVVSRAVN